MHCGHSSLSVSLGERHSQLTHVTSGLWGSRSSAHTKRRGMVGLGLQDRRKRPWRQRSQLKHRFGGGRRCLDRRTLGGRQGGQRGRLGSWHFIDFAMGRLRRFLSLQMIRSDLCFGKENQCQAWKVNWHKERQAAGGPFRVPVLLWAKLSWQHSRRQGIAQADAGSRWGRRFWLRRGISCWCPGHGLEPLFVHLKPWFVRNSSWGPLEP